MTTAEIITGLVMFNVTTAILVAFVLGIKFVFIS